MVPNVLLCVYSFRGARVVQGERNDVNFDIFFVHEQTLSLKFLYSPALGGLQIPDGLVGRSCTSHHGVLGSIPKREEPGTGASCVEVPGSSRVPRPRLVVCRSTFLHYPPPPTANSIVNRYCSIKTHSPLHPAA